MQGWAYNKYRKRKGLKGKKTFLLAENSWYRKTGRLLYICYIVRQQNQSSLPVFLYHKFSAAGLSTIVFSRLCFCTFYTPIPYMQLSFPQNFLPIVCFFIAAWQQTHKEVRQYIPLIVVLMLALEINWKNTATLVQVTNFVVIKQCFFCSKAIVWCVVCSH